MRYRQYRFKFYLNASHAIYINGKIGERHPHTWEIAINALKMQNSFIQFDSIEKKIEKFMQPYQDGYLNDVEPFDKLNPTLENCCVYFKDQLRDILNDEGWLLIMIEMSETPTRSYVINLIDGDERETDVQSNEAVADSVLEEILKMK